jgi:hypothetical protein
MPWKIMSIGGLLSSDGGVMPLREIEQRQKALAGEDRGALLKIRL